MAKAAKVTRRASMEKAERATQRAQKARKVTVKAAVINTEEKVMVASSHSIQKEKGKVPVVSFVVQKDIEHETVRRATSLCKSVASTKLATVESRCGTSGQHTKAVPVVERSTRRVCLQIQVGHHHDSLINNRGPRLDRRSSSNSSLIRLSSNHLDSSSKVR